MAVNHDTVYLKGDRNVEVQKKDVTLGDIVAMECSNKEMIPKLKTLKILKIPDKKKQRMVISILKIIACIHEKYPGLEVQNMGEQDIIITYEEQKTPGMVWHVIKTVIVVLITFCGAAFSIMAFNNDVSTSKLFSQIYEFVTGDVSDGFTILEVSYSVGITVGILVFFNHFGKKRFTVDPTPMEVQMRLYENDIQTTLVEDASRREQELDVGKSNHISSHRT
ncbi:stage V sporulation protein AA [Muricomes sp. OA1]|uniref:Stage V sporulation protein AA n=1 Tax=Hungatella hathewayi TaxID=154046 RepID=A0A3E2WW58_9FIRM|nr:MULTISPECIES: stage V sporulation protein AA [Clostridia]MCH1975140.1 stage V sporulation protein AA [Muricomes sp. OA1]MRM90737.1 stage V sporulation protein AA [Faecalicatena contorta]RGC32053.1 stage V sporulation protein AA [Hungatella hathewayi]GKH33971.1 stage V sporulation protein AA [Faecalicatena contorta]